MGVPQERTGDPDATDQLTLGLAAGINKLPRWELAGAPTQGDHRHHASQRRLWLCAGIAAAPQTTPAGAPDRPDPTRPTRQQQTPAPTPHTTTTKGGEFPLASRARVVLKTVHTGVHAWSAR